MLLGENFVKEFNEQQEKFKRKSKYLNESYLDLELPIERMLLELAVKEEMMYLHNMMRIREFEQKVDPIIKRYYPEYKNSEELLSEGILSDGADLIANWYNGLTKMQKMDLGVDIGVSALSLIPKIGAVPAVMGVAYYLFRTAQAYEQGNRFESIVHFISALLTIPQIVPAIGTAIGAGGKLIVKLFTSPFQTLGKIFAHFGGRLSKAVSTGTYELASFLGFGGRLSGTHVDNLINAARIADSEKVYLDKAMEILETKLRDPKFKEMLEQAVPDLNFDTIGEVAEQAKYILGALQGSKNKDKFDIVTDLVEAIGDTNLADNGAHAALEIRRQIEIMRSLGDDAAERIVEMDALVEKAKKLKLEADRLDAPDMSGRTQTDVMDELQQTKIQLERELNALEELSPGAKQVEQLKVRLKQAMNEIDIKISGRPIARSQSLRTMAGKILADKERLAQEVIKPLQDFGQAVFDLAENASEAFAREFTDQLSDKSNKKVLGRVQNVSDPDQKLKLIVQKDNVPEFDAWLGTTDGLEAQKKILQKSPIYQRTGMATPDAQQAQIIQDGMDDLRSTYNTSNADEIPFDQFILDNDIPLTEVLADNKTLTQIKRQAIEDTKSVDRIAQNFVEQIPKDVGEAEYRNYRARYAQYFSTDLYLTPGPAKKWFAKMHNKIANDSILSLYWDESIPDKYGLVIKKVALNLFADPVINFLNDDTESIGESEAIDASILNSLSNAAHAAGSAFAPTLDMSTTTYNF